MKVPVFDVGNLVGNKICHCDSDPTKSINITCGEICPLIECIAISSHELAKSYCTEFGD